MEMENEEVTPDRSFHLLLRDAFKSFVCVLKTRILAYTFHVLDLKSDDASIDENTPTVTDSGESLIPVFPCRPDENSDV